MNWLRCVSGLLLGLAIIVGIRWLDTTTRVETVAIHSSHSVINLNEETQSPRNHLATAMIGKASCSGIACHGNASHIIDSDMNQERWRTSYLHWQNHDPHQKAYESLTTAWAKSILQKLDKTTQEVHPENDQRCLACHTTPSIAWPKVPGVSEKSLLALRKEGVSCEACHENASNWLMEHTTWKTEVDRKQGLKQSNMADLNDPGMRAMACAGCHVGAPADPQRGLPLRDMNHDMIASGHPRLHFDYSTFLARMSPHWREVDRSKDAKPPRAQEEMAAAWLAGQLATAEAFCQLSSDRANRATKAATAWPELAEFKCYGCHQNLGYPNESRPLSAHGTSALGRLHAALPLSPHLAGQLNGISPPDGKSLVELLKEMQLANVSDPATASKQAKEVADALRKVRDHLATLPIEKAQPILQQALIIPESALATYDWDDFASLYYGVIDAIQNNTSLTKLDPESKKQLDGKIAGLADSLRFSSSESETHSSPRHWDRKRTTECYLEVSRELMRLLQKE